MCLSAQALALFISLLPSDIVETSSSEVHIASESGLVVWDNFDDRWCTTAPLVVQKAAQSQQG